MRINNTDRVSSNCSRVYHKDLFLVQSYLNLYINDLFLYIKKATLHNYADDNTLTAFSNSTPNLVKILEQESNVAIDWHERNQMIENLDKFHAFLVTKGRDDTVWEKLIQGKQIQSEIAVRLLGVIVDHRLTFDDHISNLSRKAVAQLNALKRLKDRLLTMILCVPSEMQDKGSFGQKGLSDNTKVDVGTTRNHG